MFRFSNFSADVSIIKSNVNLPSRLSNRNITSPAKNREVVQKW